MSRAFVREQDDPEIFDELPDRPISPHPNLVTPEGLALIEAHVARLQDELSRAQAEAADEEGGDDEHEALARIGRDLRYWMHRRSSAEVVPPNEAVDKVYFGSRVTIERDDGRTQQFRIVGEDEADPTEGRLSYVSPLARELMGKTVGDIVIAGQGEAEIVEIG
ncbi:transcription elongation factor GreA [Alsobacter sp. SYSU M60028]|uniref:Transcription elongation factor GreA n=1 Tax=Alsobacter ponti TaxID=2962936 RepID=A0ABT1LC24_9HYPH|nr:transcription elongation factor GreA [Alsobacter ponti]MCP8939037.1 transcription elongation factor GreA [Alsobacter ponti]